MDLCIERAESVSVQIQRHFERLIRSHALADGERLPTTRELARNWKVNLKTVQLAMRQLQGGGLIVRRPHSGTFVSPSGRKTQIGILVGLRLLDESMAYYRAITQAIQAELHARGLSSCVYDHLDDENGVGSTNRERLLSDIRNQVLEGLIMYCMPDGSLRKTALSGSFPCVWHGGPPDQPPVRIDCDQLFTAAVDFLARKGRKRLFCLLFAQPYTGTEMADAFRAAVTTRGLTVPKNSPGYAESAAEQATYEYSLRLIEQWKTVGTLPDGMIVGDDVVMKGMALALRDHQIRVPEQLSVVCVTSHGVVYPYAVPVVRLEISPTELAAYLVERLWRQIMGKKAPPPLVQKAILREPNLAAEKPLESVGAQ